MLKHQRSMRNYWEQKLQDIAKGNHQVHPAAPAVHKDAIHLMKAILRKLKPSARERFTLYPTDKGGLRLEGATSTQRFIISAHAGEKTTIWRIVPRHNICEMYKLDARTDVLKVVRKWNFTE